MPVGLPPLGGPLGRSRSRISASGLTTFLRCKRQWFLGSKLGLSGPTTPSQVLGIVIEDELCGLLMHRPDASIDSLTGLSHWMAEKLPEAAQRAYEAGQASWDASLWRSSDWTWEDIELSSLEEKLRSGLTLFMEEVNLCLNENGGPYLEEYRSGRCPFGIPSPAWGDEPRFPVPDKVRSFGMRTWARDEPMEWNDSGTPVSWHEAWEIARPWVKDPRVHQPQRLYHPGGWAAGELDLVLRWDGRIRLIDIKSGDPTSRFAASLQHQLRFYAWLWHETHEGATVDGLEGWYLNGPHRIQYDAPSVSEIHEMTSEFYSTNKAMQSMGDGPVALPVPLAEACDGEAAGCHWCSLATDENGAIVNDELLESITSIRSLTIKSPSQPLSTIPNRVHVQGTFTGAWGPLPNHFGEPVLGAMLMAGGTQLTVEESEPGSYPSLHDGPKGELVILNALPGVWRGSPRLYLDSKSELLSQEAAEAHFHEQEKELKDHTTRLGLLRTRANVEGIVLSLKKRSGVRLDEKPWTMFAMHLWDGKHVVEIAAFGSSISGQMEALRPGDHLTIMAAELGWRAGLPQLRIDNRKTRLTVKSNQHQS
jgi:hypothetical protein